MEEHHPPHINFHIALLLKLFFFLRAVALKRSGCCEAFIPLFPSSPRTLCGLEWSGKESPHKINLHTPGRKGAHHSCCGNELRRWRPTPVPRRREGKRLVHFRQLKASRSKQNMNTWILSESKVKIWDELNIILTLLQLPALKRKWISHSI